METSPTLGNVYRSTGVAGQVSYRVAVTYPDDAPTIVEFVGNVHGGPIVMITPGNPGGTFVKDPERFGDFSPEWVRRFFA